MMRGAALIVVLFCSACFSTHPIVLTVPPTARFIARPVHVLASTDMSPDCRAAVYSGTVWFQHMGVSIDITWVEEDHPSISLEPRSGQIAVHAGIPTTPNALAETWTWRLEGTVDKAEIVMGSCDPWVFSHEAGHALGLPHQVPEFELMHPTNARGRWGLSPEERAHIRD